MKYGCKMGVALILATTLGLIVLSAIVFYRRNVQEEDCARTALVLERVARELRKYRALTGYCERHRRSVVVAGDGLDDIDGAPRDAWGSDLIYRCPGPIHKDGWDLISCGPNGVYEEGQGDDIVVGEDLPGGLASIESGSAAAVGSWSGGKK